MQTPQQSKFLVYYLNPQSETYSSARASAVRAGYTQSYADSITTEKLKWLVKAGKDNSLVQQAVKNLSELLGKDTDVQIQADVSKFVLSRLHPRFKR